MRARVILHGAILAIVNLFSIWLGFIAHALIAEANQLIVQVPVAIVVSVVVFVLWGKLVDNRGPKRISVRGFRDGVWIYCLALVWAPLIFVPLHFVTAGYLTAFSNILAMWVFQLITNLVAIDIVAGAAREESEPVDRRQAGADISKGPSNSACS